MAIEDEIINISDIDIGTEILNNDKLLIETNNGTKMVAFKDFVIGPDNISSIRQSQIEGNPVGEATARFTSVSGFDVLNTGTTAGMNTKYSDISGVAELTKFLFDAVAHLATLSAQTVNNNSLQTDLQANIASLESTLAATDSSVLNSITLTTKSCNFIVTGATRLESEKPKVAFTASELDPSTTNSNCSLNLSPFLVTYPSANQNFNNLTVVRFAGYFVQNRIATSSPGSATQQMSNGSITLYREKEDGTSEVLGKFTAQGELSNATNPNNFNITAVINQGDKIRLTSDSPITGRFEGIKS